jgi:hypothetical protein
MFKARFPISDSGSATSEPRQNGRRNHSGNSARSLVKLDQGGNNGVVHGGGTKLDRPVPLNLNDRVTMALSSAVLNGRVVWLNGMDCGIAFDEPVDCLWNDTRRDRAQTPARTASAKLPVITAEGRAGDVVLTDLSRRVMKGANDGNFRPGLRVQVILDDGCEEAGLVRWSRDNIAGVVLLQSRDPDEAGAGQRLPKPRS